MASIKPRRRHGPGEASLKALEAEMQRAFSMKMGQLKRTKRDVHEEDPDSGVIYVSHIPHGFYEPQMKKFFSQFGNIKRLRLSRSKKSGKSKGYAYIEFEYDEVAKVVAETMHNYLMYQKLLKCFYVPKDKLHPDTFKGCFRHFKSPRRREISAARNNSLLESGKDHILESQRRRVASLNKKQKKLEKLGINFKIEGVDSEWKRLEESQPPPAKISKRVSSKVTAKTPSRSKKPAVKQEQKGPVKRKMAKTAGAPKSKKISDGGKPEVVAAAKKRKPEKEAGESKEKKSKQTEGTVSSKGKAKQNPRSGAQSAKVPSRVKSVKGARTAGKKTKRLSL